MTDRLRHGLRSLAAGLVLVCLVPGHAKAAAQEADELPAIFALLDGDWEGTGQLMGRPAVFTMTWRRGPATFARLSFTNAWTGEDGGTIPVLRAEAVYLLRGDEVLGSWLDDRPQRVGLEGAFTETSLTVNWTAESEAGRTEYEVVSDNEVVVRDYVLVDGEFRPFGEARYGRLPVD